LADHRPVTLDRTSSTSNVSAVDENLAREGSAARLPTPQLQDDNDGALGAAPIPSSNLGALSSNLGARNSLDGSVVAIQESGYEEGQPPPPCNEESLPGSEPGVQADPQDAKNRTAVVEGKAVIPQSEIDHSGDSAISGSEVEGSLSGTHTVSDHGPRHIFGPTEHLHGTDSEEGIHSSPGEEQHLKNVTSESARGVATSVAGSDDGMTHDLPEQPPAEELSIASAVAESKSTTSLQTHSRWGWQPGGRVKTARPVCESGEASDDLVQEKATPAEGVSGAENAAPNLTMALVEQYVGVRAELLVPSPFAL
jgi:hypothetical protein